MHVDLAACTALLAPANTLLDRHAAEAGACWCLQDLFNMIHSVSKDMITVIQCMPRLAERTTQATLVQLKARACLLLLSPVAAPAQLS